MSGQNLDHLHTIAIKTGLVHLKIGLSIFGLGRTYEDDLNFDPTNIFHCYLN